MGYYVDIFYDRKYPKIEYKIPFASAKGINKCTNGNATLEKAHDDVLHQNFYTIVSTSGYAPKRLFKTFRRTRPFY